MANANKISIYYKFLNDNGIEVDVDEKAFGSILDDDTKRYKMYAGMREAGITEDTDDDLDSFFEVGKKKYPIIDVTKKVSGKAVATQNPPTQQNNASSGKAFDRKPAQIGGVPVPYVSNMDFTKPLIEPKKEDAKAVMKTTIKTPKQDVSKSDKNIIYDNDGKPAYTSFDDQNNSVAYNTNDIAEETTTIENLRDDYHKMVGDKTVIVNPYITSDMHKSIPVLQKQYGSIPKVYGLKPVSQEEALKNIEIAEQQEYYRKQREERKKPWYIRVPDNIFDFGNTIIKGTGAGLTRTGSQFMKLANLLGSGYMYNDPVTGKAMRTSTVEEQAEALRKVKEGTANEDEKKTANILLSIEKVDKVVNKLQQEARPSDMKKDDDFISLLSRGDIGSVMQYGLGTALESAPAMIMASTPFGRIMLGSLSAADKYNELTLNNEDIPLWKRAVSSVGYGAIEQWMESRFNPLNLFKSSSKEVAEQGMKQFLKKYEKGFVNGVLKNLGKASLEEGMEEVGTDAFNDILNTMLDLDGKDGEGIQNQYKEYIANHKGATAADFAKSKFNEYANDFIGGAIAPIWIGAGSMVTKSQLKTYNYYKSASAATEATAKKYNTTVDNIMEQYDNSKKREGADATTDEQKTEDAIAKTVDDKIADIYSLGNYRNYMKEYAKYAKNTDGKIYEGQREFQNGTKNDIYIVEGNIELNDDGTINTEKSDGKVKIRYKRLDGGLTKAYSIDTKYITGEVNVSNEKQFTDYGLEKRKAEIMEDDTFVYDGVEIDTKTGEVVPESEVEQTTNRYITKDKNGITNIIVGGNIVLNDDGTINYAASDKKVSARQFVGGRLTEVGMVDTRRLDRHVRPYGTRKQSVVEEENKTDNATENVAENTEQNNTPQEVAEPTVESAEEQAKENNNVQTEGNNGIDVKSETPQQINTTITVESNGAPIEVRIVGTIAFSKDGSIDYNNDDVNFEVQFKYDNDVISVPYSDLKRSITDDSSALRNESYLREALGNFFIAEAEKLSIKNESDINNAEPKFVKDNVSIELNGKKQNVKIEGVVAFKEDGSIDYENENVMFRVTYKKGNNEVSIPYHELLMGNMEAARSLRKSIDDALIKKNIEATEKKKKEVEKELAKVKKENTQEEEKVEIKNIIAKVKESGLKSDHTFKDNVTPIDRFVYVMGENKAGLNDAVQMARDCIAEYKKELQEIESGKKKLSPDNKMARVMAIKGIIKEWKAAIRKFSPEQNVEVNEEQVVTESKEVAPVEGVTEVDTKEEANTDVEGTEVNTEDVGTNTEETAETEVETIDDANVEENNEDAASATTDVESEVEESQAEEVNDTAEVTEQNNTEEDVLEPTSTENETKLPVSILNESGNGISSDVRFRLSRTTPTFYIKVGDSYINLLNPKKAVYKKVKEELDGQDAGKLDKHIIYDKDGKPAYIAFGDQKNTVVYNLNDIAGETTTIENLSEDYYKIVDGKKVIVNPPVTSNRYDFNPALQKLDSRIENGEDVSLDEILNAPVFEWMTEQGVKNTVTLYDILAKKTKNGSDKLIFPTEYYSVKHSGSFDKDGVKKDISNAVAACASMWNRLIEKKAKEAEQRDGADSKEAKRYRYYGIDLSEFKGKKSNRSTDAADKIRFNAIIDAVNKYTLLQKESEFYEEMHEDIPKFKIDDDIEYLNKSIRERMEKGEDVSEDIEKLRELRNKEKLSNKALPSSIQFVVNAIKRAGVNISVLSIEEIQQKIGKKKYEEIRNKGGEVMGFAVGKTIYLNAGKLNPKTPLHEYTHLWVKSFASANPRKWGKMVRILKTNKYSKSVWDFVENNPHYAKLDEYGIASEVLSRLTEDMYGEVDSEGVTNFEKAALDFTDGVERKSIINTIRDFWYDILDRFFGIKFDKAEASRIREVIGSPINELLSKNANTTEENLHISENNSNFAQNKEYERERNEVAEWLSTDDTGAIQGRSLQTADGELLVGQQRGGRSSNESDGTGTEVGNSRVLGVSNPFGNGLVNPLTAVNDAIESKLSDSGIKHTQMRAMQVDAKTFHNAISEYKRSDKPKKWCVDVHDVNGDAESHPYVDCVCLLLEDGKAGIAITPDGDVISLFSNSTEKHVLDKLVPMALALGGKKGDFYTTESRFGLQNMYARYGLVVTGQTPFNTEFASDDWDGDANHTVGAGYFQLPVEQAIEFRKNNADLIVDLKSVPVFEDVEEDGEIDYGYDQLMLNRNQKLLESLNNAENNTEQQALDDATKTIVEYDRKKVRDEAIANGTFMTTPKGTKTKLTEQQWIDVRTPMFKEWFGDWENSEEHGLLDEETGEPMIVYHGSPHSGFDVFDYGESGSVYTTNNRAASNLYAIRIAADNLGDIMRDIIVLRHGIFNNDTSEDIKKFIAGKISLDEISKKYDLTEEEISDIKDVSELFEEAKNNDVELGVESPGIYQLFCNIRNPKVFDFKTKDGEDGLWNEYHTGRYSVYNDELGIDKIFGSLEEAIKYAEENSLGEDSIEEIIKSTDDLVEATQELGENDGCIFLNVKDGTEYVGGKMNDYVAFSPDQLKSANLNSGAYDANDERIEYSIEGMPKRVYTSADVYGGIRVVMEKNNKDNSEALEAVTKKPLLPRILNAFSKVRFRLNAQNEYLRVIQKLVNEYNVKNGLSPIDNETMDASLAMTTYKDRAVAKFEAFKNNGVYKELTDFVESFLKTIEKSDFYNEHKNEVDKELENENIVLTPEEVLERYLIAKDNLRRILDGKDRGAVEFYERTGMTFTEYCDEFEKAFGKEENGKDVIVELWNKIRRVTDVSLNEALESGLIDAKYYYKLWSQNFYIPQRGNESKSRTEEDVLLSTPDKSINATAFKKSHGGESLGSDVFANLEQITFDMFVKAERNRARMKMYNLLTKNKAAVTKLGFKQPKALYKDFNSDEVKEYTKEQRNNNEKIRLLLENIIAFENKTDRTREENYYLAKWKEQLDEAISKSDVMSGLELGDLIDNNWLAEQLKYNNSRSSGKAKGLNVKPVRTTTYVLIDGVLHEMELSNCVEAAQCLNEEYEKGQLEGLKVLTGYLSAQMTSNNLSFAPVNFMIDNPTILTNGFIQYGAKFPIKLEKNVFALIPAVFNYVTSGKFDESTEDGRLFKEFMLSGANTGFGRNLDYNQFRADADKMNPKGHSKQKGVKKGESQALANAKKALGKSASFIDKYIFGLGKLRNVANGTNDFIEMINRFAAYKTILEMGLGKNEALRGAKELSINFSRRGHGNAFLSTLNNFSMFANATIQGSSMAIRALNGSYSSDYEGTKQKVGRISRTIISAMALPAILGYFFTMLSPDDDEEEKTYSDYDRMNNAIFGDTGLRWRLSELARPFWTMGAYAYLYQHKHKSQDECTRAVVESFGRNWMPMPPVLQSAIVNYVTKGEKYGGSDFIMETFTPEALDKFNRVSRNEDYFGKKINKDNKAQPEYDADYNAQVMYRDLSKLFYIIGGGDPKIPCTEGMNKSFDISPKAIKEMMITPAFNNDLFNLLWGLGRSAIKGENVSDNVSARDIPVLNRVWKPVDNEKSRDIYRLDIVNESRGYENELKNCISTYKDNYKNYCILQRSEKDEGIKEHYENLKDTCISRIQNLIGLQQTLNYYLRVYQENNPYNIAKKYGSTVGELEDFIGKEKVDEIYDNLKPIIDSLKNINEQIQNYSEEEGLEIEVVVK